MYHICENCGHIFYRVGKESCNACHAACVSPASEMDVLLYKMMAEAEAQFYPVCAQPSEKNAAA